MAAGVLVAVGEADGEARGSTDAISARLVGVRNTALTRTPANIAQPRRDKMIARLLIICVLSS